ncbi:MAG: MBL fold metallo-hydrolase [Candidatus Zixiibacteriota bacterium]
MISLSFHGAARTVTGSKYLVGNGTESLLVDCGVFQGLKELRLRNWDRPRFDAAALGAVILSHAHVDHSAYLPRLYHLGFRGPVWCSEPTARLAEILLYDAAHLQEEDARFLNKKQATRHKPALPLFTVEDVRAVLRLFRTVTFEQQVRLSPTFSFRLHLVGHILGAGSVVVTVRDDGAERVVCFSGDVGRYGRPLLPDPLPPPSCDYLVCESTYGDRRHEQGDPAETVAALVHRIVDTGGVLLIPAFAVGRAQEIVFILRTLVDRGAIPKLPIHVDGPMAIDATKIFCDFPRLHRLGPGVRRDPGCALHAPYITYHRTPESSKALNALPGPRIIIAGSGMLTGGRILHHLMHRMERPETIIALAGFQATGTRGRDLLDGKRVLRFHGREHEIHADVVEIAGLSAHADYGELMRWLAPLTDPPRMTFVTHGEPHAAIAMAERLTNERGFATTVPELGDEVAL